jgi:hypothetical protein
VFVFGAGLRSPVRFTHPRMVVPRAPAKARREATPSSANSPAFQSSFPSAAGLTWRVWME